MRRAARLPLSGPPSLPRMLPRVASALTSDHGIREVSWWHFSAVVISASRRSARRPGSWCWSRQAPVMVVALMCSPRYATRRASRGGRVLLEPEGQPDVVRDRCVDLGQLCPRAVVVTALGSKPLGVHGDRGLAGGGVAGQPPVRQGDVEVLLIRAETPSRPATGKSCGSDHPDGVVEHAPGPVVAGRDCDLGWVRVVASRSRGHQVMQTVPGEVDRASRT